jgi:hypothetical protein
MGAEFVHVGFACPFNLGGVSQLVTTGFGKGVEVALDAGLDAFAKLRSIRPRLLDGSASVGVLSSLLSPIS